MRTKIKILLVLGALFFASCATYYDHYTLTQTVEAKAMMDSLIANATNDFADHETEVNAMKEQINKMVIYETAKDKDIIMLKMWQLLASENSAVQDFFETWESQGSMSEAFIPEFKPEINNLFDLMIDYESKKDKKAENALMGILNLAINP